MSDAAPETVRIAAAPETVWSFWTEPERLAEWWGVGATVEAQHGDEYRVEMGEGPVMVGNFVELDPPRRLVFSFGWEANAAGEPMAPGSTTVEVTMQPDGADTVLVLRHFDMPVSHSADHAKGWAYFLGERLAAVAGRGA